MDALSWIFKNSEKIPESSGFSGNDYLRIPKKIPSEFLGKMALDFMDDPVGNQWARVCL